ncbi:serine hydrolase domain-containing protein [Pseudactinotalea sp.]|uniref:serine hydrolase domain-containing protein n=1 Tax=Pseudactinotalea sp. TaxID=1926260 RepID=UPI003B3B8345
MTTQSALTEALESAAAAALAGTGSSPVSATPGAVALLAHEGQVIARGATGSALAFDADAAVLPLAQREPVTPEHVWDIASITKVVTTLAALVQADRGAIDLDAPVVRYLPAFGADEGVRGQVLVRHLLTHTAGLPPVVDLMLDGGASAPREAHVARVLASPVVGTPGQVHVYSCVGYLVLGLVLESVTSSALPDLVAETVTGPLGMAATGYVPPAGRPVVPTEVQHSPERGLVRGEVHDETAWLLGGAGNAGLFSDADDLLRLGEEIRTGSAGLLSPTTAALMRTGVLPSDQVDALGYDQAIGLRVGQRMLTGSDDPAAIGHTGFTGTSLVVDTRRDLVIVLLTNRVHPRRELFDVIPLRMRVAQIARDAVDR